jgi:hypothetical protein
VVEAVRRTRGRRGGGGEIDQRADEEDRPESGYDQPAQRLLRTDDDFRNLAGPVAALP